MGHLRIKLSKPPIVQKLVRKGPRKAAIWSNLCLFRKGLWKFWIICGKLYFYLQGEAGLDQGKWHSDNKCGEEQHFVCEAKPMGSCPIGWALFEGNCYFVNSVRKVSWNIAKDSCESVGASLLKVLDKYLNIL